jgi:transmembrane sensor
MDATERRRRAACEAAEWWVRLQGDVPRTEREQYVDWLRESAVHVAEMLRVAQVHGALTQFERWRQLPTEDFGTDTSGTDSGTVIALPRASPAAPTAPPKPPTHTPRSILLWATAASVLVAAGIAGFFVVGSGRVQIIETQRGERREVALADGSVVQVDPETRLKVTYEIDARRVYLEHGRALFHVAKNPSRPFLVRADDTTVRAVGTAFAVEQAPNAVVVTVAEGKVAVIPTHPGRRVVDQPDDSGVVSGAAPKTTITRHASSSSRNVGQVASSGPLETSGTTVGEIFLIANEQVTVAESGAAAAVREVDSHRELAWAEGRLIFENEPVERAVREFNHYNRIQLTVSDQALAHRSITGVFSASDPESFVAFIQTVAAVRVTRDEAADITIEAVK